VVHTTREESSVYQAETLSPDVGFYINIDNIPIYYKWIYYISFFRYSYEALLANEFRGLQFACNNSSCIPTGTLSLKPK